MLDRCIICGSPRSEVRCHQCHPMPHDRQEKTGTKRISLDWLPGGAQGAGIETAPKDGYEFVVRLERRWEMFFSHEMIAAHWERIAWWLPMAEIERQVR